MKTLKIIGAVMAMASPVGCMSGTTGGATAGMLLFAVGFVLFVIGRLAD